MRTNAIIILMAVHAITTFGQNISEQPAIQLHQLQQDFSLGQSPQYQLSYAFTYCTRKGVRWHGSIGYINQADSLSFEYALSPDAVGAMIYRGVVEIPIHPDITIFDSRTTTTPWPSVQYRQWEFLERHQAQYLRAGIARSFTARSFQSKPYYLSTTSISIGLSQYVTNWGLMKAGSEHRTIDDGRGPYRFHKRQGSYVELQMPIQILEHRLSRGNHTDINPFIGLEFGYEKSFTGIGNRLTNKSGISIENRHTNRKDSYWKIYTGIKPVTINGQPVVYAGFSCNVTSLLAAIN